MYKEYTCFIYSLDNNIRTCFGYLWTKLWSVGKTFSGTFSPHQNYIRKPVGSVLDSLFHLLRVKENTWIAGRSRLWPRCTLATSGKQRPGSRFLSMKSHLEFWGILGAQGSFGICTVLLLVLLKVQAFPNHLGIPGAFFDPTWSVQTGGRRRRMLRPWQPREFASSFTTPFRKILHFLGGGMFHWKAMSGKCLKTLIPSRDF